MKELFETRIKQAIEGRKTWLWLQKKYKLGVSDYVLLIPSEFENVLHLQIRFHQFLMKKKARCGVILFPKGMKPSFLEIETIEYLECDRNSIEELIRFYCMYQFTNNLLIASLTKPDGRMGEKLMRKKGLTRDEVLDIVVFGIEKEEEEEYEF